jgi:hypothetical protein
VVRIELNESVAEKRRKRSFIRAKGAAGSSTYFSAGFSGLLADDQQAHRTFVGPRKVSLI